jgi:hypothetical protein
MAAANDLRRGGHRPSPSPCFRPGGGGSRGRRGVRRSAGSAPTTRSPPGPTATCGSPSTASGTRRRPIAPDGTVTEYNSANMTTPVGITAGPTATCGSLRPTVSRASRRRPGRGPEVHDRGDHRPAESPSAPTAIMWTARRTRSSRSRPATPNTPGSTAPPAGITGHPMDHHEFTDGNLWLADFGVAQVSAWHTERARGRQVPDRWRLPGGRPGPGRPGRLQPAGVAPYYIGRLTATVPGEDPSARHRSVRQSPSGPMARTGLPSSPRTTSAG